jgi:hypothetical protein
MIINYKPQPILVVFYYKMVLIYFHLFGLFFSDFTYLYISNQSPTNEQQNKMMKSPLTEDDKYGWSTPVQTK